PHILVTTPESLFILLTSARPREMLSQARTVIVDEIHAVADDKRGSHLALTLARLDRLVQQSGLPKPQRIGLSATVKPVEDAAARWTSRSKYRGMNSAPWPPTKCGARFTTGSQDSFASTARRSCS